MDIQKAKNDIIYFAENIEGLQLQEWQKDLLLKYQQGEIIFFGGYRSGKNMVLETIRKYRQFSA